MADTGVVYPGSCSNVSAGTISWANTGNAVSDNGSSATCATGSGSGKISDYLTSGGHDFSEIPDGSTIDGFAWDVEISASTANRCSDYGAYLTKDGANPVGTNKATSTNVTSSFVIRSYGGPTDLHGATWTASEVKASTFGAMFQIRQGLGSTTANVDFMRVTVYFTPPVGPPASASSFFAFF